MYIHTYIDTMIRIDRYYSKITYIVFILQFMIFLGIHIVNEEYIQIYSRWNAYFLGFVHFLIYNPFSKIRNYVHNSFQINESFKRRLGFSTGMFILYSLGLNEYIHSLFHKKKIYQ